MRLSGDLGYLTYCLNVHPTETWEEIREALTGPARAVKAAISPDASMMVGLRFSAQSIDEILKPKALEEFIEILATEDFEARTVNAFPYGKFYGVRVKEAVYQPDWRTESRLTYTCRTADLMAAVAPADSFISISTVPGTFKPLAVGAEADMADRLLRAVSHFIGIFERTGKVMGLAIEPEPCCFLETVDEAVRFFEAHLFSKYAARRISEITGLCMADAATALPRHLGLCYDVCHAAVEFEDPTDSLDRLRRAGIPVHKLQLSSGLRLPIANAYARRAVSAFNEPTFLHQVVSREKGTLKREADLPRALARGSAADLEEWRVHFHVPIFVDVLPEFETTQDFLTEILELHARRPISKHLEVETYTWGVLPKEMRNSPLDQSIAREIRWVLDRLGL